MQIKKLIGFLLIIVLFVPAAYGLTAAIGNARAVLHLNGTPENPTILERTILVQNKNEIAVKARLSVEKEFEKFINILDPEVDLEADESTKARYILTMDRGGTFQIRIQVRFEPLDPSIDENKVGTAATLIIISQGPTIEDPEEEEVEEEPEEESKTPTEERENPFFQTDTPEFDDEETPEETEEPKEEMESTEEIAQLNPLIGVVITIIIVGIGLAIFFVIRKLR